MCDFQLSASMMSGLNSLLSEDHLYSDDTYLKVSQDYVREVVAHEVGHTLGLRHNFAGSLYANFDVNEKKELFFEYARSGKAPSHIETTSSVMEYQNFEEAVITGDQMVSRENPDYDKMVIESLYYGKTFDLRDLPPFCTDSGTDLYLDCKRFDSGNSIYKNSLWREEQFKKSLPYMILYDYIKRQRKLKEGEIISLEEATPDPIAYSVMHLSYRNKVLDSFTDKSKFLSIFREVGYNNKINTESMRLKNYAHAAKGIKE